MSKMKAATLYFATAFTAGLCATPVLAQSTGDLFGDPFGGLFGNNTPVAGNPPSIFVDPNAPPNAPLSIEQDEFISSVKDAMLPVRFRRIARSAKITQSYNSIHQYRRALKPIADWTQGDLLNFHNAAQRYDQYLNEIHAAEFFEAIFATEGGGDGGGDGDGGD